MYNQSHTRNHHHQSINRKSKHQPQPAHKVQPRTIPNHTGRLLIKNQVVNITPLSNRKLMNTLTQAPETARNSMSMLWRSTRPAGMRGRNITEWEMVLANFTTRREVCMRDTGGITWWMARATCTTLMVSWLMRANGGWMSSMGSAKYTTRTSTNSKEITIIMIFLTSMIFGLPTKVSFTRIVDMEKGRSRFRTDRFSLVNSSLTPWKGQANSTHWEEKSSKAYGKTTN